MNCPLCSTRAFIVATRARPGNWVRRRYQCPDCFHRFNTQETLRTKPDPGRDAWGRFSKEQVPPEARTPDGKFAANTTQPTCGQCEFWLRDGCGKKLRPPSRAKRFNKACEEFVVRTNPEPEPRVGRAVLPPPVPAELRAAHTIPGGRVRHTCRSCSHYWGGKCDLGLQKPMRSRCEQYEAEPIEPADLELAACD